MKVSVSEVMTKKVVSVKPETALDKVTELMSKNSISGMPVVDDNKILIGIVTEKDIIKFASSAHVIPVISTSGWISPHTDVASISRFRQGIEMITSTKVKDVMTKKVVSVEEDAPVQEVAKLMNKNKFNRVPVVNKEGKLVGIFARQDLFNYLIKSLN